MTNLNAQKLERAIELAARTNPGPISQRLFELEVIREKITLRPEQINDVLIELWNTGQLTVMREDVRVKYDPNAANETIFEIPQFVKDEKS